MRKAKITSDLGHYLGLVLIVAVVLLQPVTLLAVSEFENEVGSRVVPLGDAGKYTVGEQVIYGGKFIASLYQGNSNQVVWSDSKIEKLQQQILGLKDDGLNPGDYWFTGIESLLNDKQKGKLDSVSAVNLDILLSEAFIRAYYNLYVGKVDPERLDDNFNFSKSLQGDKLRPKIVEQVIQGEIGDAFDDARPSNKQHIQLRNVLIKYRQYQDAGGWAVISAGKTLKPGEKGPRISQLRARLKVTGDYTGSNSNTEFFDTDLEAAVRHFQTRHGIDVDGAVGPKTLATLNIPVQNKIDQLRVNLERQRWYMHENQGEFIVADIAGFHVYWVKNDEVIWDTRAQVGTNYTQTPMFKDAIKTIEFNPTWTIPPGIMRRTILPNLKKDSGYLEKKGFLLLTQDGKEVDPKSVDWASIKNMPYMVRQPAGPDNALGLVKFLFPNKHLVYLHDTNHREHFSRSSRSFSSGCVRIDKPFDFAEKLLVDHQGWDRQKIDEVVASGKTTRVNLKTPVRIVIAYITTTAREGEVIFKEDVYERDAKVLKALDSGFKMRARDK